MRKAQNRWEAEQLGERKQAYLEKYGFLDPDSRYSQMTFDNYIADTEMQKTAKAATMRMCAEWLESGYHKGILLYSPLSKVGVGKTHLAVAACRFACEHLQSIAIWGMPAYITAIKAAYESGGVDKIQKSALEPQVLLLDDLGAEVVKSPDWYQDLVYSIMDERWLSRKATLVTTNKAWRALAVLLGPRAMSRMLAMTGDQIEVDGDDRR
jgi:DNA replication protein DnaC